MDDWRSPSEFVVRLDHVTYRDGDERYDHVARFNHDGHSVFIWNPPDDGFHIDFYPNGTKINSGSGPLRRIRASATCSTTVGASCTANHGSNTFSEYIVELTSSNREE